MSEAFKFSAKNEAAKKETRKKQERFLKEFQADPTRTIISILDEMGVSQSSYGYWRAHYPEFASKVTTIKSKNPDSHVLHPREVGDVRVPFKGNFIQKRLHYFGWTTPWFQERTSDAYEKAGPGDIVLVLYPPEHGKTSFTEDDLTLTIAEDKSTRITLVSEGQGMARKISRRIQNRLEALGPIPDLVLDHGPFEPQGGEGGARQPWGVDAWTVYGANQFDNRDYTVATGGWRSQIAGTRTDRLHLDDLQSLRSLNSTEDMVAVIRQDMLTRPGESGKTTGNGTRVGENDIYAWMKDEYGEEDFFQLIEYPAIVIDHIDGEPKPLWERDDVLGIGYTMEMLDRLRKKVGEDAWWRNYMQQPRSTTFTVFSDDGIEKSRNHKRSMNHTRDQLPGIGNDECWITLDPSIGGVNVVAAMHPGDELVLLEMRKETDLPRNSAIAQSIETVARSVVSKGWRPTKLIIEAMAFQKGLVEDEFIVDVCKEFGMRVESHLTGTNKYDENIGIPSMASSFEAGLVDLPYSSAYDRAITDGIVAELKAWKPTRDSVTGKLKFKRGNKLVQDQLMALWFGWVWWTSLRTVRNTPPDPSSGFSRAGLPYTPTRSGLLVPR